MTGKIFENSSNIYQDQAKILFDYYKAAGVYTEVDGRQSIEKVTQDLIETLKA